jgi:hypothetical protein
MNDTGVALIVGAAMLVVAYFERKWVREGTGPDGLPRK